MKDIIAKIKASKTAKVIIGVGVALMALAAVMITALVLIINAIISANTVKLTDYVKVSDVKGCNGYGYVEYELDKEALALELVDERKSENSMTDLLGAGMLSEMVKIEVENNGSFSNGDVVKVVVSLGVDEGFDKKIVGGTITKKVSGLKEVKTLDLFKDFVDIKFTGKNGDGKVEFAEKESYSNDVIKNAYYNITYNVSVNEKLSNGQKITVTATVENLLDTNKELLTEGMAVAEEQTKELVVENLWTPIERNQVTNEVLESIKAAFKKRTGCQAINDVYFYWGQPIAGTAAAEEYDNTIFAYFDYINKNGANKREGYRFADCHEITTQDESPCSDIGLVYYYSFFGTSKKTTKAEALSSFQRYAKQYDITLIK